MPSVTNNLRTENRQLLTRRLSATAPVARRPLLPTHNVPTRRPTRRAVIPTSRVLYLIHGHAQACLNIVL